MDKLMIVLQLIGGTGILLFSIDVMKNALEIATESVMEKILGAFTKNRLVGIIMGALVTVINQKSTATTAIVIGLVNAGVLSLIQAACVIMGANIGTTITAQMLAFPLESFAPAVIGAGVIIWRIFAHKKVHHLGEALIGFGMMFIGMSILKGGMIPLANASFFSSVLNETYHLSPLAYMAVIVTGFALAAILKSSSVMMGIIIAMAMQGILTFDLAMPLILGVNTGKCMPTLYSGAKANRTARRVAFLQMAFYVIGDIVFIIAFRHMMEAAVVYLAPYNVPRQIAHAHTLFNLGNTILLLPFVKLLVKASDKLVSVKKDTEGISNLSLDKRMLEMPGLALAQTAHELMVMANVVYNNFTNAFQAFYSKDGKLAELVHTEENNINLMQKEIESYLVKLSQKSISNKQHKQINLMMSMCADIEKMGGLVEKIAEVEEDGEDYKTKLSQQAMEELSEMSKGVSMILNKVVKVFNTDDPALAKEIIEDSIKIEESQKKMRDAHVERLNEGTCAPGAGVVFIDLIVDMAAIANNVKGICNMLLDSYEYKNN